MTTARGARIVVYHGVCHTDHTRYNNSFLRINTFEEHLKFYKEYFSVVTLDDFYEQRFSGDKYNICLSFDDGYENNYNYVLPLLEKYELPATFFVTAIRDAGQEVLWNDFMGIFQQQGPKQFEYQGEIFRKGKLHRYFSKANGQSLTERLRNTGFPEKAAFMKTLAPSNPFTNVAPEYWRQMTVDQIRGLSASKWVTIGSHGYYHNDLGRLPIKAVEQELRASKRCLEEWTGKPIRSIAFPYGTYLPETIVAASNAGYDRILTLDHYYPEDHANPSMRERFVVNPYISPGKQMLATIKRTYAF